MSFDVVSFMNLFLAITDCDEFTPYFCFDTGNKDTWMNMYKNCLKRGITLEPFGRASQHIRHTHLQVIRIGVMCSKSHLDDMKNCGSSLSDNITPTDQPSTRPTVC